MERQWYLSRGGQVFGPVTEAKLRQSAAAGRIDPTDMLNIAGDPNWWAASAIPGLLAPPTPKVEPRTLRVTCFACFNEVALVFAPGVTAVPCPKCRAELATGETEVVPAGATTSGFPAVESPEQMKERLNAKVAAAYAAEAEAKGTLAGIVTGLLQ